MDFFVLIERMGEVASVYDWCNHLDGYAQLKQAGVLQMDGVGASTMRVRTEEDFLSYLEIDNSQENKEYEVEAWNPVSFKHLKLTGFDRRAMRVNRHELGILLSRLLIPSAAKSIHERGCLLFLFEEPAIVALLFPCDGEQQREAIRSLPQDKSCIILTVSKNNVAPVSVAEIMMHHPNVHLFHVSDYIGIRNDAKEQYSYVNDEPFNKLIERLIIVPKQGTLLRRPNGATWKDLRIVLTSPDLSVEKERIVGPPEEEYMTVNYVDPWSDYHDTIPIRKISSFCKKNGKSTGAYTKLREFARAGLAGVMTSAESAEKTNLTRLRIILREMFGYTKLEDPIPNPERNATLLVPAFKIKFSHGKSDPVARKAALVPLSQYLTVERNINRPTPRRGSGD